MVLGLPLETFTQLHLGISLVAIVAGVLFFAGLADGNWFKPVNFVFLVFTFLTSVTGFLFPPEPIGPPFIFGAITLVVLAVALYALYGRKVAGSWRATYLAAVLFAQWLNLIVLVVQAFRKVPTLNALAPTGSEPPFVAAQAPAAFPVAVLG